MDGFSDTGSIPVASTKNKGDPSGSSLFLVEAMGLQKLCISCKAGDTEQSPIGLCSTGDFCERRNSQKSQFPPPDAKHRDGPAEVVHFTRCVK